jgi:hypothetical protein
MTKKSSKYSAYMWKQLAGQDCKYSTNWAPPNWAYSDWMFESVHAPMNVVTKYYYPSNSATGVGQSGGVAYQINYPTQALVEQTNQWYSASIANCAVPLWQFGGLGYQTFNISVEESDADKAARRKQQEEREAAQKRAERLLISCLSSDQVRQYLEHGYFETAVNDKVYRIKTGRSGNVELMVDGKPKFRYCAHPNSYTPDQDVMLSQLLMLRTDEAQFLKIANRTVLG